VSRTNFKLFYAVCTQQFKIFSASSLTLEFPDFPWPSEFSLTFKCKIPWISLILWFSMTSPDGRNHVSHNLGCVWFQKGTLSPSKFLLGWGNPGGKGMGMVGQLPILIPQPLLAPLMPVMQKVRSLWQVTLWSDGFPTELHTCTIGCFNACHLHKYWRQCNTSLILTVLSWSIALVLLASKDTTETWAVHCWQHVQLQTSHVTNHHVHHECHVTSVDQHADQPALISCSESRQEQNF